MLFRSEVFALIKEYYNAEGWGTDLKNLIVYTYDEIQEDEEEYTPFFDENIPEWEDMPEEELSRQMIYIKERDA